MLIGLSLEIEGRMVEGEIVEREKARQVYEKIVDEMLDPALLEWEQGNWFKLRVFPLPAKADKKVVIRYITPLTRGATGWAPTPSCWTGRSTSAAGRWRAWPCVSTRSSSRQMPSRLW